MAKIAVSIQTETAEIPHTFDCSIGLEQNINTICSGVSKLVGIPAIYALSLPDGTILKEEVRMVNELLKIFINSLYICRLPRQILSQKILNCHW
jgi:hypothetical protein